MALTSGSRFGPYEILATLGAGGMGEVYRARDERLGRDVALKVLPSSFAVNAQCMVRFEREAQVLACLNHPGIASIFGLEDSRGIRGLVMEMVEGPTLADRLRQGPIPLDEALHIGKQIAEALEYAHERGIVHRDLKPANVKVSSGGTVKVLDFGLAKAIQSDSAASDASNSPTLSAATTQTGIILGTAAYMSPEQACGKPVDRRADVWAFGALLFEMLTGQPLYDGETTSEILARVIEREPDLSRLPAATPVVIRELIRRCLTKNARQRLRDIGDARLELDEYFADPSAGDWTTQRLSSTFHPVRSRRLLWLFGGLALGALAAGMASWRLRPMSSGPAVMRFSAVTNSTGIDREPSLSPDGRSLVFVSNRGGQFDVWVGLVAGGNPVRITNDANMKAKARWSPDGTKIAYARINESGLWDVWMVPALGGASRRLITNAADPAWSPDGKSLAYANLQTGTIWTCGEIGDNPHQLTEPESNLLHRAPAFSRDGRRFVYLRGATGPYAELVVRDLASNRTVTLTDDGAMAGSPVWSADDHFIYFSSSRGGASNLWKISSEGGSPAEITAGRGADLDLDVSADGQRIVFSTERSTTNLLEVNIDSANGAGRKWLTTDSSRGGHGPAYSPDGRRIVYFTARLGAEHESIWVMDADGSNAIKVVADERLNVFPRWTRDGQAVIFSSRMKGINSNRRLRRLNVSGTVPEELPITSPIAQWGDPGPEGLLVFRPSTDEVRTFDSKTGKTRTMDAVRGGLLRWSPDGRYVASNVSARQIDDPESGVWLYDLRGGVPRQVFHGWVFSYGWAGADELFVLEGKPDLNNILWRVRVDGASRVRIQSEFHLGYSIPGVTGVRFDVNPDRRHIVLEAPSFEQADIGMIENVR